METPPDTLWCCFIDPETDVACEAPAEWRIRHGAEVDDYTESCTAHVGELLTDSPVHLVRPIGSSALAGADPVLFDIEAFGGSAVLVDRPSLIGLAALGTPRKLEVL